MDDWEEIAPNSSLSTEDFHIFTTDGEIDLLDLAVRAFVAWNNRSQQILIGVEVFDDHYTADESRKQIMVSYGWKTRMPPNHVRRCESISDTDAGGRERMRWARRETAERNSSVARAFLESVPLKSTMEPIDASRQFASVVLLGWPVSEHRLSGGAGRCP